MKLDVKGTKSQQSNTTKIVKIRPEPKSRTSNPFRDERKKPRHRPQDLAAGYYPRSNQHFGTQLSQN